MRYKLFICATNFSTPLHSFILISFFPGWKYALNDDMKPRMYGDMEAFAQELREAGFQEVRLVDTATEVFGSRRRAAMMMLGESRMLVGRK